MIRFFQNKDLKKSYDYSIKVMKERAVSFYYAFSHLEKERFLGVASIYAFCRYADDVADGDIKAYTKEEKLGIFSFLEDELSKIYIGRKDFLIDEIWWDAFVHTVKKYKIPIEPFIEQLKGQKSDTDFNDINNISELIEYSRLVAGSVGGMMMPILKKDNKKNEALYNACVDLGIGMQITNILRDVGEDIRNRNRVYIPLSLLKEKGIDRAMLIELSNKEKDSDIRDLIPKGFIEVWEELATLADTYYERYLPFINEFHKTTRLPLVGAALSYREIGVAVRKEGYNCFTKRCYTKESERITIIKEAKRLVEQNGTK